MTSKRALPGLCLVVLGASCSRLNRPTSEDQPEWTAERIEQAMHAEAEKHVKLKEPVPVHILYFTSWLDSKRAIQFRHDVYGYDRKHLEIIRAQP